MELTKTIRDRAAKVRALSNEQMREMALADDPAEFDKMMKAIRTVAGYVEEDSREKEDKA